MQSNANTGNHGPKQTAIAVAAVAIAAALLLPGVSAILHGGTTTGHPALWTAAYNEGTNDIAEAIAVGPEGLNVFVAGAKFVFGSWQHYTVVSYDALTGDEQWTFSYNGDASLSDVANGVVVDPTGSRVYVTGYSFGFNGECPGCGALDFYTLALDATTGEELWNSRWQGKSVDEPTDLALSPDGSTLFVTGTSWVGDNWPPGQTYTTIAYDTSDGSELWSAQHGNEEAASVALGLDVDPDGDRVYVTGLDNTQTTTDMGTIAYDADDGAVLWRSTYDAAGGTDEGRDLVVDLDGSALFVVGRSDDSSGDRGMATLSLDAATGDVLWNAREDDDRQSVFSISVHPDGGQVYSGGTLAGSDGDYAIAAYDTDHGGQEWLYRYDGVGSQDLLHDVALAPNGNRIYATGQSWGAGAVQYEFTTVSVDTATGLQIWESRYDGNNLARDYGRAITVSPLGDRVYATGFSSVNAGPTIAHEWKTVAYLADPGGIADPPPLPLPPLPPLPPQDEPDGACLEAVLVGPHSTETRVHEACQE